jgi:actin-related protein
MKNFNRTSFYFTIKSVLTLYASARVAGAVLDSGDSVTHTRAIYDSNGLAHAI